uniref:Uncharacterized protein n=1 Tax=Physcomitrium patens TaxID=3218 RepID=A0A2K1L036_PHYPA|nr:hypothetical protein PHYPA_002161 [Physcomitrium patens]
MNFLRIPALKDTPPHANPRFKINVGKAPTCNSQEAIHHQSTTSAPSSNFRSPPTANIFHQHKLQLINSENPPPPPSRPSPPLQYPVPEEAKYAGKGNRRRRWELCGGISHSMPGRTSSDFPKACRIPRLRSDEHQAMCGDGHSTASPRIRGEYMALTSRAGSKAFLLIYLNPFSVS